MLLDTSGLLCSHYQTEPFHTQARAAYKQATLRLTHNYILAEYVALTYARRFPRSSVLSFIVDLSANPDIETIWVTEALHRAAVELLLERQDKGYSLCNSVSFVVMRQRGITGALSTDRHFEQKGFNRLLQPQA